MILEMHGNSHIFDPCSACADCLYGIPNPSETSDYSYASAIPLTEAMQTYAPNLGAAEGYQLFSFSTIPMSDSQAFMNRRDVDAELDSATQNLFNNPHNIDDLIASADPCLNAVYGCGHAPSGLLPACWLGQVNEYHQQATLVTGLLQDSHSSTSLQQPLMMGIHDLEVASAASLWNNSQDSVLPFRQYQLNDNESQLDFANPNPYNFGSDILPATCSLQIETHCQVEQVLEDNTITPCTGPNVQGGKKKRGRYDAEKKQKTRGVRQKGACARCRIYKEPVRIE
jgi:hypothetical protein